MPTLMECGAFSHAGARLAFSLAGPTDGPRIVLMHGILMDSELNRDLAAALAQAGYRVALLDLQGHGRSDKTTRAQDLRIDVFGQQALALLDHLGWPHAVIGGVSLGAITALHVAVQAPDRVDGLFLEMPVMERAAPAAALLLVPLLLGARFAAKPWRGGARQLRRLPRPQRGLWQSLLNTVSQDPEHMAAIIHGVLAGPIVPPLRERLRLSMPSLVVGHAGDWLHNLKDARALSQELPNAELIVARSPLELRTAPTRLMPDILRFFERTQAARSARTQQQA